ncbi:MAG: hypothetical protein V1813_03690 [Candidatus Aenigmatarchaeota archaeon]
MGKLVIVDECLIPRRFGWLYYEGPDSFSFLKGFRGTLRFQFDVSSTRIHERKLLWDYTGDPIRCYSEWFIRKEVSRFSEINWTLRFLGYSAKATREGNFSLELYGEVKHTFDPSNWLMKYVWLFYNYLFYNKIRDSYTVLCRDYLNNFLNWAKEKYGMRTVDTPEASLEEMLQEQETEKIRRMAQGAHRGHEAKEAGEAPKEMHQ